MSNYRDFTVAEINFLQAKILENILEGFSQTIQATLDWWLTDECKQFFQERQYRITEFFNTSGISEEWSNIIEERAQRGADIVEGIYNYASEVRMDDTVREYTKMEVERLNYLCDQNYELIKDVTTEQVKSIREALVQDYAEGVRSKESELLSRLEEIQLQPIHTFSPEQRAKMIARTETNRAINVSTIEQYRADGVLRLELLVNSDCDECNSHATETIDDEEYIRQYTIDEALEDPLFHPNCSCRWKVARDEEGVPILHESQVNEENRRPSG